MYPDTLNYEDLINRASDAGLSREDVRDVLLQLITTRQLILRKERLVNRSYSLDEVWEQLAYRECLALVMAAHWLEV